jgi:hypothetical protein
LHVANVYI